MAKLADAARKFGLNPKGYKMTWQNLTELDSPAVLHVNPSHFVAVCPSKYASENHPDHIRVFDSAKAPDWWSREQLEKSWSGAALVIAAHAKPKRAGGPRIMFDSLIHDLGDVRVPLNAKFNLQLHFENAGNETLTIGDFDATIDIVTKVPGSEQIQIPIRGVVVSSISVKPAALFFSYDKGQPVSKTVTLESRTGRTLDLNAVSLSNDLPVKVAKQNTSDKTIQLTVTCSPSRPPNNTATGDILCSFPDETVVIPVIIHSQPRR